MMNPHMKFQDSSFNGLKVTVGTKSVTHPLTHAPKAICPINFFKVGGINMEVINFNALPVIIWCQLEFVKNLHQ